MGDKTKTLEHPSMFCCFEAVFPVHIFHKWPRGNPVLYNQMQHPQNRRVLQADRHPSLTLSAANAAYVFALLRCTIGRSCCPAILHQPFIKQTSTAIGLRYTSSLCVSQATCVHVFEQALERRYRFPWSANQQHSLGKDPHPNMLQATPGPSPEPSQNPPWNQSSKAVNRKTLNVMHASKTRFDGVGGVEASTRWRSLWYLLAVLRCQPDRELLGARLLLVQVRDWWSPAQPWQRAPAVFAPRCLLRSQP